MSQEGSIAYVEAQLAELGMPVRRGGEFDSWDLEVQGGLCGGARLITTIEEHGAGRQFVRFRIWTRVLAWVGFTLVAVMSMAVVAAYGGSTIALLVLASACLVLGARMLVECGRGMGAFLEAIESCRRQWNEIDRTHSAEQVTYEAA
jgi:hypothetical protein